MEALAGASETGLGLSLQIREFAVLGVELARASVFISDNSLSLDNTGRGEGKTGWWAHFLDTYVWAWTAMLRSSGIGLKEWAKRSCM